LEKKLHAKLARESIAVRRQEQAKKDRLQATRREEELAMKENMVRLYSVSNYSQLENLFLTLLACRSATDSANFLAYQITF
jgi:hypothetical protein